MTIATASSAPAGGAAIGDVILATVGGAVATAVVVLLAWGHRSGRLKALGRAAAFAERQSGLPGWVALPSAIATVSLLTALFGMYWDISLHIDVGRDPGPLANPAHYFILAGLFGIFTAGFLAVALPEGDPGPTSVPIGPDWRAPLGGLVMLLCGGFALIGFPLDDAWHRLFGQDVTLWGPTHLMLIGGATMSLLGQAILLVEGERYSREHPQPAAASSRLARNQALAARVRMTALCGGFLIGLSTFQAEFDFGVPQFRMIFQPVLIALAASAGLMMARQWGGRGAALGAAGFFLAVRGMLALLVGPVLGEATPHFPLYLGSAAIVELVALAVPAQRPLVRGAAAGALLGTIGLAIEYGWSHAWMTLPWPQALIGQALVPALIVAIAGGMLGAWAGYSLRVGRIAAPGAARLIPATAALAVAAMVGFGLLTTPERGVSARVALTTVQPGQQREVQARVTIDPASAARDADWLTATAWQGGGLVVNRLERTGNGTYRTTEPIPVHDDWKALIRLHAGNSLLAAPIYLPADSAIPAREVPAERRFDRTFIADHKILQRESKASSGVLTPLAYGAVLVLALALIAMLGWAVDRVAATSTDSRARGRRGEPAPGKRRRPVPSGRPAAVGR